nr:MAG TPA: hypothetical protein [Caudoviricetes sp.]
MVFITIMTRCAVRFFRFFLKNLQLAHQNASCFLFC